MRIVCPACEAAYEVPEDRIRAGRIVRCARCATDWVPVPRLALVEPGPVAVEAVEPSREGAHALAPDRLNDRVGAGASDRQRGGWLLGLAWVLSVAAVLAGLAAAVVARERVIAAWPPSIRAYQALGLI